MEQNQLQDELAGRDQRLMAAITDGLLQLVSAALGLALASQFFGFSVGDTRSPVVLQLIVYSATLPVSILQWYLVATRGQSVGKILQRIRVERMDGRPVGFKHGVLLRSWVIGVGAILFGCIRIFDYVLIFRDDRRCVHDWLADTKVVKLPSVE